MQETGSLIDAFEAMVAEGPGRRAVAWGESEESLTYAELDERSARVAGSLAELGVRRGGCVAVWLPNVPEWLVLELACARLGAMIAPLNTRYRSAEATHLLRMSEATVAVVPLGFMSIDFLSILADALGAALPAGEPTSEHLPDLRHIVTVDLFDEPESGDLPEACIPFERLEAGPAERRRGDASSPLNLFVTSGTTGPPKLAVHDQGSVTGRFQEAGRRAGVVGGDALLCALPLCGVWGVGVAVLALTRGATCVLLPTFDPEACVRLIERWGVTHVHGSDGMLRAILEEPGADAASLSTWRGGNFGNFTGRPGEELVELARRTADITLGGAYGSSEGLAMIGLWLPDDDARLRGLAGGNLIGEGTEVRACDPESGEVLDHEIPGELHVRGPSVMTHYLNNPDATAQAFSDDGWFKTGDLGYTMPENRIIFLSRLKDSLRLRGFLVDPQEIEEHLAKHPEVRLAQVVGVDGPRGQLAVAFVQRTPTSELDGATLRAFCRERIADFKVPARIEFVEEFPVTDGPNGVKIQKFALRERAAALVEDGDG